MAPPRPLLPLGLSDFPRLREPGVVYVDKTRFITQVLAARRAAVLIPRPRRFGKTVNMSALRYFVERSEEDRSALFEGLEVWGSEEARAHFQRYPTIWLTFKDVKAPTFEGALAKIQKEISALFRRHLHEIQPELPLPIDAREIEEIVDGQASSDRCAGSLLLLSRLLEKRWGQKVFLLIDEYDTPIHSIRPGEDERRLLDFFRVLLGAALKDNPHLYKGVLTGILRVAKESLFSGLNNLVVHSILSPELADCFGFTEDEVKLLADRTGASSHLPDLAHWYNGYRFGRQVIYNPWSILCFLDSEDKVPRPYWVQTSSDDLLRRIVLLHGFGHQGELETLLSGGEIKKRVDERISLRDLERRPDAVWSFLLFTGYLKATTAWVDEEGDQWANLAVPNKEVQYAYRHIFQSWMEERLGATQVDELHQAIVSGDTAACERLLGLLLQSLSVHDVGGRPDNPPLRADDNQTTITLTPERVYHVFVVSLLLGLQPRYVVRSNRESGGGRYDVMVIPRAAGQPGVVLELKVRNRQKRETPKSAMATALRQIRERDYAAELRAAGASPIHEIGIVFDGKQVWVASAPPLRSRSTKSGPARKKRPTGQTGKAEVTGKKRAAGRTTKPKRPAGRKVS
jgi:hypothetical protein